VGRWVGGWVLSSSASEPAWACLLMQDVAEMRDLADEPPQQEQCHQLHNQRGNVDRAGARKRRRARAGRLRDWRRRACACAGLGPVRDREGLRSLWVPHCVSVEVHRCKRGANFSVRTGPEGDARGEPSLPDGCGLGGSSAAPRPCSGDATLRRRRTAEPSEAATVRGAASRAGVLRALCSVRHAPVAPGDLSALSFWISGSFSRQRATQLLSTTWLSCTQTRTGRTRNAGVVSARGRNGGRGADRRGRGELTFLERELMMPLTPHMTRLTKRTP
jgi:hypothetical protein